LEMQVSRRRDVGVAHQAHERPARRR
jgi:hypothetical protein